MDPIKAIPAWVVLTLGFLSCVATAQKVKIGFDKTADFSQYHTYSWGESEAAPTEAPLRRAVVMAEVESELAGKGLERVDQFGDLTLDAQGALGGEIGGQHQQATVPATSSLSSPMNTVWRGAPVAAGSYVLKGTIVLSFVDTATNSMVWEGTVATKLDHGNEDKNFKHLRKAIAKLLEQFPPKKK
jgi:hypothetical protein